MTLKCTASSLQLANREFDPQVYLSAVSGDDRCIPAAPVVRIKPTDITAFV